MVIFRFAQKLDKAGHKMQARKVLASVKKEVKDFSFIKGNEIVSDDLLEGHFKLYKGYVEALNKICDKLDGVEMKGNYSHSEYSELKRRMSVAYNGASLHEQYFAFLDPNGSAAAPSEKLKRLIEDRWGSVEEYLEDVKQTALAAGNGWVITYYEPSRGLENALITEHHIGLFYDSTPIMVLDTWEHAFAYDYKTDREAYVTKFLENLNFELMESKLPQTKD